MKTRLYPFQLEDLEKIGEFNCRNLVASSMGLGKSVLSLAAFKKYAPEGPALVICPASLKLNWWREASKHLNMNATVLSGIHPARQGFIRPSKLYIVNYDILGARRNKLGVKEGGWLEFLKNLNPAIVIVDECQRISDRNALRTRAVKVLCKGVEKLLFLSGTPITSRHADLFPTLNILWPKEFPSFFQYAQEFCSPKRTWWGWDVSGSSNSKILNEKLVRLGMIRRNKADVLTQLPPKRRIVVPMDMEKRKDYDKAVNQFLEWLKVNYADRVGKARKAERLTQLSYLRRLCWNKAKFVFEWIDDFLMESDGKILLFGVHKKPMAELHERYKKISVVIDGDKTAIERQRAEDAFQKNPRIRILIGNKAIEEGLNLTAAHTIAHFELPWTPAACAQREDRAYGRLSDLHGVDAYYLVAKGSVEEHLCKILQRKSRIVDQVLDGKVRDDGINVFDQLTRMLDEAASASKPKTR